MASLYRTLTARYPGRCGKCRGMFPRGSEVAVVEREYLHPACAVALHPGWAWPVRWSPAVVGR